VVKYLVFKGVCLISVSYCNHCECCSYWSLEKNFYDRMLQEADLKFKYTDEEGWSITQTERKVK
jgi:hypothetical protein